MAERPSTRAVGGHRGAGRPVGLEAARPPVVSIHELGTLGGAVSHAKAVNRAGQVVGTSRDGLGRTRAFLWQEKLGIVDLKPRTGVNTSAHDMNDAGAVVGLAETNTGQPHAFLWTAADGLRDLGALGAAPSMALGINNRAEVVGGSGHAFLWTEQAGMVDLGTRGRRTEPCWTWARSAASIVLPRPSPKTMAAWSGSPDTATTSPGQFARLSGRCA